MQTNRALTFIFITLLIDVIGFGIIIPVLPNFLSKLENITISEASMYGSGLLFAFASMQFIFSPILGSLSDEYGRRPVLLFSLLGFAMDYLILAFAPNFYWLIVGRVIAGITGASFTTASAYIADVSTDENRTQNFGMIGAAFGLGFIIGPLLGGYLGSFGLRIPFYATAVLSFINFLYGFFILPESLPLDKRRKFEWKRANPIGTLHQLFKYQKLRYLIIAFVLLYLGSHAVQSTWSFFTIYRFGWSEKLIGGSLAVVGILVAIVQVKLAQYYANQIGKNKSIYIGFGLYTLGMFLFSVAPSTLFMFLALIPYCLGGIAMPNLQAYMSESVGVNQQGELQGGLTSLVSVTTIIGPLLMNNVFYFFTHERALFKFPGAAFFLGGIFMFISFAITYKLLSQKQQMIKS